MQLTPTEAAVYRCLLDGEPHAVPDLLAAMDPLAQPYALRVLVFSLRKKLRGKEILCYKMAGQTRYQLVRKIAPES